MTIESKAQTDSSNYLTLLQDCLRQATVDGQRMMLVILNELEPSTLVNSAVHSRRMLLPQSAQLLKCMADNLAKDFPLLLDGEFQAGLERRSSIEPSAIRYEQLQLLDEADVEERIEWGRLLIATRETCAHSLQELNTLMSALQGYRAMQPDHNPLRPERYLAAIQQLFQKRHESASVRQDWIICVSPGFSKALNSSYKRWIELLKARGVQGVGFGVSQSATRDETPPLAVSRRGRHESDAASGAVLNESVLTLKRLRNLFLGNFDAIGTEEPDLHDPAPSNSRQSYEGDTYTIPAALEVLQEMNKVSEVMDRLVRKRGGNRPRIHRTLLREAEGDAPLGNASGPSIEENSSYTRRANSHSVGQLLALEVASLMLENIAENKSLLPELRKAICLLEEPLLQLVTNDKRSVVSQRCHVGAS